MHNAGTTLLELTIENNCMYAYIYIYMYICVYTYQLPGQIPNQSHLEILKSQLYSHCIQ